MNSIRYFASKVIPSQYLESKIELYHLILWLREEEKSEEDDRMLDEQVWIYFPIPQIKKAM